MNRLIECPETLVLVLVSLIGIPVGANLHPIDGEALRDESACIDGVQSATMWGHVRRAVPHQPLAAIERRSQDKVVLGIDCGEDAVDRGLGSRIETHVGGVE